LASKSLRCLKVLSPYWTTLLRCCDSSPTHNRSGLHLIRAITMAATSPIDSVCCVASCRAALVSSSHASWLSHPPSHRLVTPAGCCIASRRPLIALPSRHLVTPAGCHIASCRLLVASPSPQLVAPACCHITSPCPLVAPSAALSSSRRAGWLLCCLSARHPLDLSSSHCAASCCLIAPAGCCAIISCRPLVAPHSRPLIVLPGCCVACPS